MKKSKTMVFVLAMSLCISSLFTGCGDEDKIEIDSRSDKTIKANQSISYDVDKANEETPVPAATPKNNKDKEVKKNNKDKEEESMFKFGVTNSETKK